MSNRALYLVVGFAVFAATAAMLGAATNAELWHSFVVSETQLLVAAAVLIFLLRNPSA